MIILNGASLSIEDVAAVATESETVRIGGDAMERMQRSRRCRDARNYAGVRP
jgi:histidine ammonia-lyase